MMQGPAAPLPASAQWMPEPRPRPQQAPDIRGRHRKQAEINRLNQEIRFLEEELEKLDKADYASVACKELVIQIENTPDPLITRIKGSLNSGQFLNRWFEQPAQTKSSCWIC